MSKYGPRIKNMFSKFMEDNCMYYSAVVCFYILTCAVPMVLLIVTIVGFFPINASDFIYTALEYVFPEDVAHLISGIFVEQSQGQKVIFTSIYSLTAIYSAGSVFMAIMQLMDRIYGVDKKVPWIKRRLRSTKYTMYFLLFLVVVMGIFVYGGAMADSIADFAPNWAAIIEGIEFCKPVVLPIGFIVAFTLVYRHVPNRSSSFFKELPGAIVATIGWLIFTNIYYMIVNRSTQINLVYGSLTNFIMALFWLYFGIMIIFFGAEFNSYIEHGWIVLPKWMIIHEWPIFDGIRKWYQARKVDKVYKQEQKLKEKQQRKEAKKNKKKKHKIDNNSSNSAYDTESFVEGTYRTNDIKNDDINSDNTDKKTTD